MNTKLETVNAAIAIFAPGTTVRRGLTGWLVEWADYRGKQYSRRWAVQRGSDTWPVFHRKWTQGGTGCNALAQLMRWLQDRPVFGISTWQYWVGPSIRLGKPELIDVLLQGGYPADHVCVLCGKTIVPSVDGLDWWSLKGVSGPSCRFSECRNKERCK
jgi:hypothetical protein